MTEAARRTRTRLLLTGADDRTWQRYARHSLLPVWVLVLLHSRLDPDHFTYGTFSREIRPPLMPFELLRCLGFEAAEATQLSALRANFQTAEEAVRKAALVSAVPKRFCAPVSAGHPLETLVSVSSFREWAASVDLPVVDARWQAPRDGKFTFNFPGSCRLLRELQHLAWLCSDWQRQPGRWPNKATAEELAVKQCDVSPSEAKLLATILNPDERKKGGRPPSR